MIINAYVIVKELNKTINLPKFQKCEYVSCHKSILSHKACGDINDAISWKAIFQGNSRT